MAYVKIHLGKMKILAPKTSTIDDEGSQEIENESNFPDKMVISLVLSTTSYGTLGEAIL